MTGAPVPDRAELAGAARERLVGALDRLLDERLRLTEKRPRDGAGWVDVSAHDLATVCAARWSVPADDFVMSAATVAGAVGRLALRERDDGEPVAVAVARVLDGIEDYDREATWFAEWYRQDLDRSGRAAVRAAATTWATGALGAVQGRSLAWATRRHSADVPDRMVRLRANWDSSVGGARPEVLVAMSGRAPSDPVVRTVAGFNALVDGLQRRQVPARIRIGSASLASTTAVAVTSDLLDDAVDRVVELVGWRVEPASAPTSPGRWCAECHLLDICPDANRADPAP